jgi:hypothetical protein
LVRVAVNMGTKAWEKAPSANIRRPRFGIIWATMKTSMPDPAPNARANIMSRIRASTRDTSVMAPTTPVLLKMALLTGRAF